MKRIITFLLLALAAFSYNTKAQPNTSCNAEFSFQFVNNTTVKFTPVLIGDSFNTFHHWNFGDGSTSALPIPTHVYTNSGSYNVKHIIYKLNPNGVEVCRDTFNRQVLIQTVPCNLVAYFTWQADNSNSLKIYFTNLSVPLEPTDSVRWTFGDGSSSLDINPAHTYNTTGTYTVCLRVKKNNTTGTSPCVKEICKTIVVTQPCNLIANFISQPDPAHPLRIKFTNLSNPAHATDSVRWTFGDGTSVSGLQSDPNVANPTHIYTTDGAYTVCLRVKKNINSTGTTPCVKEICKVVTVLSPCNIQVNFSMHRDSLNPAKVHFNNLTVTTSANAIAKWSFGDGTFAGTWNAVHEYKQPGTYKVCLLIQTSPNCIKEKCETIVIPPPVPSCKELSKFKFEKSGNDNQHYKFIPEYISNDIVYTWTFGDGTGSHDPIAVHRYTHPGLYVACLTAWRGPNCASTTCKEIKVLPQINCDSIRVIYSYQFDPLVPNKVYFNANGNFPILDQTWTITKLSPATSPSVILHQNNPSYVFRDTGYYRVCLKAITLGGCVKEICKTIRIERVAPVCFLQAYPNPASNLVNVNVHLAQPEMIHAFVYNTLNVQVREKHQQGVTGNNLVTINVNDLTPGLYTIKMVYGNKTCYARFNKM